jgi:hypothetical protein
MGWIFVGCVLLGVIILSLWQGVTWDEPWLYQRALRMREGFAPDPFKPLSGLLLLPLVILKGEYLGGRVLYLGVQVLLGCALWTLLPRAWPARNRALAVAFLWLEPTFRERVLEMRTDPISLALLLLVTYALATRTFRLQRPGVWLYAALLLLGLGLSPKLSMWLLPWIPAALLVVKPGPARAHMVRQLGRLGAAAGVLTLLVLGGILALEPGALRPIYTATTAPFAWGIGFLPRAVRIYAPLVFCKGWPFWLLAFLGLGGLPAAIRRRDPCEAPLLQWELAGWGALMVTLWYQGAYVYHFMAVAAGVWPSCLRSLRWIHARWGFRADASLGLIFVGAGCFALLPVLEGPSLFEQRNFMECLRPYTRTGAPYADGVGWFRGDQAMPYIINANMENPGEGLWRDWDERGLALLVLNTRSDAFMTLENVIWLNNNMFRIHPQVLIPGTTVHGGDGGTVRWKVKVPGAYRFRSIHAKGVRVDGSRLAPGDQVLALGPGAHAIDLEGGPEATLSFWLEPAGPFQSPPVVDPFFLSFLH